MPPPVAPTVPSVEMPRWCTSPTSPSDIVVPPSGRLDVGYAPAEMPPAQWFNWYKNRAYTWIKYLDDFRQYVSAYFTAAFAGTVAREINISAYGGQASMLFNADASPNHDETWVLMLGTNGTLPRWRPLIMSGTSAPLTPGGAATLQISGVYFPIPGLPAGSALTSIAVRLKPGASRSTTSDRMKVSVLRPSGVVGPAVIGSARDDGTADSQTVTVSLGGYAVDFHPVVLVEAGSTAGDDEIYSLVVSYTDPSPRLPT